MYHLFSKNKIEKNFLITFIIVTILTIFISSAVITLFFDQKMIQREFKFQEFSLNTSENIMEGLNNKARELLVLFDNQNDVKKLFNNGSADLELKSYLIKLCEAHIPLKESPVFVMYLIDYKREVVYTLFYHEYFYRFDQFFDKEIIDYLKNASFDNKFKPMFRKVSYPSYSYNNNVVTYVYFEGSALSYANTAIVINFDKKWLEDKLSQECSKGESLYFLDPLNKTFLSGSATATKETADEIVQTIGKSRPDKKNIMFKSSEHNNKPFLLSYKDSPSQYITIAKATDYDNIKKPLASMRLTIVLIIILMLLSGAVISVIISGRIFSKVDRELKNRYHNKPNPLGLKEIYNSINTADFIDEATAGKITNEFGAAYQIDQKEELFLLLLVSDQNENRLDTVSPEINEVLTRYFSPFASAVINPDLLLTVLKSPENSEDIEKHLYEITEILHSMTGISFSAYYSAKGMVSDLFNMIFDIKVIYDFKFIFDDKTVKSPLDISSLEENSINVPISILEKMSLLIYSGEYENLLDFMKLNFFEKINEYTIFSIKETIRMLANSLQSALYNVQKTSMQDLSDLIQMVGDLPKCHNVIETEAQFSEIITALSGKLAESNPAAQNKQMDYIDKICKLVEENYQDISFSSKTIADKLNLSNIYICRIFKNAKNESLNNYINGYRIEKAAELLVATSLSAQEISKQCGLYNANYFYTLFKKYKSITANEYKKRHSPPNH